jgi:hypothetical protein
MPRDDKLDIDWKQGRLGPMRRVRSNDPAAAQRELTLFDRERSL